jgi:hypothetical protein
VPLLPGNVCEQAFHPSRRARSGAREEDEQGPGVVSQ